MFGPCTRKESWTCNRSADVFNSSVLEQDADFRTGSLRNQIVVACRRFVDGDIHAGNESAKISAFRSGEIIGLSISVDDTVDAGKLS